MTIKISAATLTYGDRLEYLRRTVDCLLTQAFEHIYIYCNGISIENFEKLKKQYPLTHITLLYSETNLGSAGGYYELLSHIISHHNSDYLLLLDDDNLVPLDCFEKISQLKIHKDELYYFHRPDRALPKRAKELQQPSYVLGTENSFLGRDFFKKIFPDKNSYQGDLVAAPYGGLLLSREALNTGVMPYKPLYLYADDYEYTYRLVTEYNFKIIFSDLILIKDLEKSFHLNKGNRFLTNRYSNASKLQLYYSVRNNTWLGLGRNRFKSIYFLNMCICTALFFTQFLLCFDFAKIKTFSTAVVDGMTLYKNDNRSKK